MSIDEILSRLHAVRRSGAGWMARCPGHEDKTPSLSIHEGERGILLRCWAGCSLDEICAALGVQKRDLFFDARPDPVRRIETRHRRRMKKAHFDLGMAWASTLREAEAVIRAATGVDISKWTPDELDLAMGAVSRAWEILLREEGARWMRA